MTCAKRLESSATCFISGKILNKQWFFMTCSDPPKYCCFPGTSFYNWFREAKTKTQHSTHYQTHIIIVAVSNIQCTTAPQARKMKEFVCSCRILYTLDSAFLHTNDRCFCFQKYMHCCTLNQMIRRSCIRSVSIFVCVRTAATRRCRSNSYIMIV